MVNVFFEEPERAYSGNKVKMSSMIDVDGLVYFIESHLELNRLTRKTHNFVLSMINCFEDMEVRRKWIEKLNKIRIDGD